MSRERTPPQVVPQQCSGFHTEARIKRLRTEPSSARAVAATRVEVLSLRAQMVTAGGGSGEHLRHKF